MRWVTVATRRGAEGLRRGQWAVCRCQRGRSRDARDGARTLGAGTGLAAPGLGRPCRAGSSATIRPTSQLLAPVPDPRKIICIGLNYRDHAAESGVPVPTEPILFSKYPTALIGHGAPIVLPRVSQEVDYEAELVVVIGRKGRHIPRERAFEHVGGYAVGHDVSARDWQLNKPGKQWMAGKTFDTFAPVGPELVTPDEVPDPHNLGIRLRLERPDHARLEHQPAHLRGRRADRLPLAGLHPRAGRPDLHRHAAGRRHGASRRSGSSRAIRSRSRLTGWGRSGTPWSPKARPAEIGERNGIIESGGKWDKLSLG